MRRLMEDTVTTAPAAVADEDFNIFSDDDVGQGEEVRYCYCLLGPGNVSLSSNFCIKNLFKYYRNIYKCE